MYPHSTEWRYVAFFAYRGRFQLDEQVVNKMNETGKGGFQPGQSGNPTGRPKGTLSLLGIIKRILAETEEGQQRTRAEQVIRAYIADALEQKDGIAIRDLIDRIDGRPMQKIEMSNVLDAEWLSLFKGLDDSPITTADHDSPELPEGSTEALDT